MAGPVTYIPEFQVCNKPLHPDKSECNIQNVWAYWQDDEALLEKERWVLLRLPFVVVIVDIFLFFLNSKRNSRKNKLYLYLNLGFCSKTLHTVAVMWIRFGCRCLEVQ